MPYPQFTSRHKDARKALSVNDIPTLERIMSEEGFTDKIDPLECGRASWHLNHNSFGKGNESDKTDYFAPYGNGFIRVKENKYIAACGVMNEVYVPSKIKLSRPHHFFFINPIYNETDLTGMLWKEAKDSPKNPAKRYSELFSLSLLKFGLIFAGIYAVEDLAIRISLIKGAISPEVYTNFFSPATYLADGIIAAGLELVIATGPSKNFETISKKNDGYGMKGLDKYFFIYKNI
jgi:hypothetical protein